MARNTGSGGRREARRRPALGLLGALAALLVLGPAAALLAYESDQYSCRLEPIEDSTEILNEWMNRELRELAEGWRHGRNERRFARAVFWRLGGFHWVDKVERFANRSDLVDKLPKERKKGIYAGIPLTATRFAGLFGTSQTIRLNGVLIGSDKLGHFLSQGHKYHRRFLRGNRPERVLRLGVRNEKSIFGRMTTGVYSNADLVANYEGYLFYRGLFEDGFVADKPALLAWDGDRPYLQRPFDWADHVNDFWDEALNPSRYSRQLQKHMAEKLEELCPEYRSAPASYVPDQYEALAARYRHIGLKEATYNRLDLVCADSASDGASEGVAAGSR